MPLVKIVPNLSEGRDSVTIERLGHRFAESGATLLDTHSDSDHNRSVFTGVGTLATTKQTVLSLVENSAACIDIRKHRGVHPRIGAVDVVPFVSLRALMPASTASECVPDVPDLEDHVRALASETAETFDVPVFLYGRMARDDKHRELSFLRRGGFEALDDRMAAGSLVPSYGPRRAHRRLGGIAMGVRDFLIAFNVFLMTKDERIARRIARDIRTSSGGLDCLMAIGVMHRGSNRAQVSMNLTDYRRTSLARAFDAVSERADALGVTVSESEIVGTVPRDAWREEYQCRLRLATPVLTLESLLEEQGLLPVQDP